jgi:predicted dehydrogenase|eukprot:COSAG06_NODE_2972_length_6011_cov_2.740528_4_plen_48_part_00
MFLRHVAGEGQPEDFPHTLREGIKGVELAELGLRSWETKQWVGVPPS